MSVRNTRTGREYLMQPQHARALIARSKGLWVDASLPAPPPPPPSGLNTMSYQELRALVRDRGLEPTSMKRDDLIAALRYQHRAMTATD